MKSFFLLLLASSFISSCTLTKVASTPLRVVSSVVSVIPVVGNATETVLDTTADVIDILGIALD